MRANFLKDRLPSLSVLKICITSVSCSIDKYLLECEPHFSQAFPIWQIRSCCDLHFRDMYLMTKILLKSIYTKDPLSVSFLQFWQK